MVHNYYVHGTHHKKGGCIPRSQATEQSIAIGDKFSTLTERMAISPEYIVYVECGRLSLKANPVVPDISLLSGLLAIWQDGCSDHPYTDEQANPRADCHN